MAHAARNATESRTAGSPSPLPKELYMQNVGSPELLDGALPEQVRTVDFNILLAEDDVEFRRLLVSTLRTDGYSVTECANGRELLDYVASDSLEDELETFDLVISDIRMPGVDALSILEGIRQWKPSPPWILITAFGDPQTHAVARRLEVAAFFDKPFDLDDLRASVRKLASKTEGDEPKREGA